MELQKSVSCQGGPAVTDAPAFSLQLKAGASLAIYSLLQGLDSKNKKSEKEQTAK